MTSFTAVFLLLAISVSIIDADLLLKKQDLPAKIDVTTRALFGPFPGTICRAEVIPQGATVDVSPVQCNDVTKVVSPTVGPFSNTPCFRVNALSAATVLLKMTCTDDKMLTFVDQRLKVIISDAAPVCKNYTIAVGIGKESRFFLLASDADDDFIQYHVRTPSLTSLNGTLKYCYKCGPTPDGDPNNSANWRLYNDLVNDNSSTSILRYSRMFSYIPPPNSADGFTESLQFSARDLSEQECPTDGVVTFHVESVVAPTVTSPSLIVAYTGRPQTVRFQADSPLATLRFTLKSIPPSTCALVCPITETARVTLRDFPGETLAGQVLEPCTPSNALKVNDDVTLVSSKDTFFKQTFLTVKAVSDCGSSPTSFKIAASADGVESASVEQPVQCVEQVQRCSSFSPQFTPGVAYKFTADNFVSSGPTFTVTTLTNGDFTLRVGGAVLQDTPVQRSTEFEFVATKSIDVTIMVKSGSPSWTGYCRIPFRAVGDTSTPPPPPTTTAPQTEAASETPVPSSPTVVDSNSGSNTTLIIVLVAVLAALAYYFRGNIAKLVKGPVTQPPARRYGVVSGDAED